jgi:hypothetical protein
MHHRENIPAINPELTIPEFVDVVLKYCAANPTLSSSLRFEAIQLNDYSAITLSWLWKHQLLITFKAISNYRSSHLNLHAGSLVGGSKDSLKQTTLDVLTFRAISSQMEISSAPLSSLDQVDIQSN